MVRAVLRLIPTLTLCCAALIFAACAKRSAKPPPTPAQTQTDVLLRAIENNDTGGALAAIHAGAILNVTLDPVVAAERQREIDELLTESTRRVADEIGMDRKEAVAFQRSAPKMPAHAGPYSWEIPLHTAVEAGRVEIVRALLAAGAHIEHVDSDGRTPLTYALWPEMVRTLLDAGANPNAVDSWDDDVLDHIVGSGAGEFEVDESPIDRLGIARTLIAAGAPLVRVSDGATRLWRAAFNQNPPAVDILLELGHPIAANDDEFHEWPLHAICWHMDREEDTEGNAAIERIIRVLVEAGHDVSVTDSDGDTPLHMAVWGDGPSVSAIRTLLELGADPAARNKEGKTPLDMYDKTYGDTRGRALIEASLRTRAPNR